MKKNLFLLGVIFALGISVSFAVAHWVVAMTKPNVKASSAISLTSMKRLFTVLSNGFVQR